MKPSTARFTLIAALAAQALLLGAPPASPQEVPEGAERPAPGSELATERILEIRHADPQKLVEVLRVFPVRAQAHPDLGLITLSGVEEHVEAAYAAARSLDVAPQPTRSIEVTAHVLAASKRSELGGGVPSRLEEVARQLREVFGYRGVELVDSLVVRVRDRAAGQLSGVMSEGLGQATIPYQLGFNRATVVQGTEAEPAVRLDGLLFEARIGLEGPAGDPPAGVRSRRDLVRLMTDLDVRAGQKAVVAKAAAGAETQALILVVEAHVVD